MLILRTSRGLRADNCIFLPDSPGSLRLHRNWDNLCPGRIRDR